MYIPPSTNITLYNIPLTKDSEDVLYFSTLSAQETYFSEHTIAHFNTCTYQRETKGMCRVEGLIGNYYSANYMSFYNDTIGNKKFYAWVDKIEYINNATFQIYFTIDPLRTWFFEMELGECFIERQHSETDNVGDNILPEVMGNKEYVIASGLDVIGDVDPYNNKIVVIYINAGGSSAGTMFGNVFHAGVYKIWDVGHADTRASEIASLNTFIAEVSDDDPEQIILIFMCPSWVIDDENNPSFSGGDELPYNFGGSSIDAINITGITPQVTGLGIVGNQYIPRNNKLYTYPYNFYSVNSPSAETLNCRYEFFANLSPTFRLTGNVTPPVQLCCYPTNYKGVPTKVPLGDYHEYRMEKITISGLPQCSWSSDAYKAWFAQQAVPMANTGAMTILAGAAGGMAVGGVYGAVAGGLISASSVVAKAAASTYQASIKADITKGSFESNSNDFTNGRCYFQGCRMSIPAQDAKIYDEYFDMFGYQQNITAIPKIHVRSRYTYVKTVDCNIHGNLPSDDALAIAEMFNRGIRFWADVDDDSIEKYPASGSAYANNILE